MVRLLYTSGIRLYALGVRLAAAFGNAKAKLWVKGRKCKAVEPVETPTQGRDSALRQAQGPQSGDWIWFHAASLGEFEQGRPVIEALKEAFPQFKILLSFFSPSGYEIRKDYPLADEVLYLPIDTPRRAALWLDRHHFVAAFFIKYEFWFNYMAELKRRGIPLFYISLILNEKSFFFKPYCRWFVRQLAAVSHFFVQDETTANLLQNVGYENVTVCGDTRFDRVAAIARQARPFPEVERFVGKRQCIVAGSTWPPDEQLLAGFLGGLPDDYCLILAPHDVSEAHIAQIRATFADHVLYSELPSETNHKVLIINTIGILSQLYQYARFVYIGGGFGSGIHNIQEPVTFGCPVVFGPRYRGFKEAVDLVDLGGAFGIDGSEGLQEAFASLMDGGPRRDTASKVCSDYLMTQLGATQAIMEKVGEWLVMAKKN